MFCGYRNVAFLRLMCFSVLLTGVSTGSEKSPTLKLNISNKGNDLHFTASPPQNPPQCWHYEFHYSKCNENPDIIKVSNWTAIVGYDVACRYKVQVQAKYDTTHCGEGEQDSNMSIPVYFGQDGDPNLPFKVVMSVIPVTVCICLIIAIVLFRRHKDTFLPQIPNPSYFFKDMYDTKKKVKQGLYTTELYVPNEELMDEVHVEPNTTHLHHEL
ncbi:uncharacterized protein LOC113657604 [Tachysurus fulvidraco]|uniref:uncharacterized protein LOC113657604 n=1 Tax=Tachysurus fulvidraco TaxID=1234273 RepID=UPI000F4D3AB5|nr:uncharacterized protein LOC113657604 [Tachysurus fulvidraco]XP_027025322.1 uncharacterized protein LOC113657604 [Tachysurus fulvidraco]XP_027025323.1 uncharacterized protein LOC113657604 [Tachysurus fulvidraco]XP_027025324.1 uncharacterized protein LOC113657604 [Tachysurus fulvidraco]